MILEKPAFNFDLKLVIDEVKFYTEKYPQIRPQICLTHSTDTHTAIERLREAAGSMTILSRKADTEVDMFKEEFYGTYLHFIYKTLSTKFQLCRFRIMIMNGPMVYYAHSDTSRRLHYVVETNSDCVFLFPEIGEQFHIPADGNVYLVDTRLRHTFVNASRLPRIHLLLSLFPETE